MFMNKDQNLINEFANQNFKRKSQCYVCADMA